MSMNSSGGLQKVGKVCQLKIDNRRCETSESSLAVLIICNVFFLIKQTVPNVIFDTNVTANCLDATRDFSFEWKTERSEYLE